MHAPQWMEGWIACSKEFVYVYTLNEKSVDILMSYTVDGGEVAVLYGSATRRKPEFFIQISLVPVFIL